MASVIVRSERVVLLEGVRAAAIHVRDGRIHAIADYAELPAGVRLVDVGAHVVLPGLVDTHVHINEPGRTDWEGFEHATRAAAAGGVTTLVDMPLNSIPPTTTVAGLAAKRAAAGGRCFVDVGFWGGVVPGNAAALEPLARAGVLGYKCFLSPSGVDEFPHVTERDLRAAMPALAALGLPLLAHAELPAYLADPIPNQDPRRYQVWLEARPSSSEVAAIELLARLSAEFGVRIHIVHLSAGDALPILRGARTSGRAVTVETCPHYLTFVAEDIADGATEFKCAPPVRSCANRQDLWRGLLAGDIDMIATDHSPAPPSIKRPEGGSFLAAWGGIASLQLGLSAVWTAAEGRAVSFSDLARWLSDAPARLAGLDRAKGAIAVGRDADLVIWDPDAESAVDPASLFHRHPVTPYAWRRLRGRVLSTMLRGETVFTDGMCPAIPTGRLLGEPMNP
jgi:allantoinase